MFNKVDVNVIKANKIQSGTIEVNKIKITPLEATKIITKNIQDAHKFADDAIAAISKDKKSSNFKNWMQSDIVIKRAYFVTVYVLLFGFIGFELVKY